jgi:hypothetical protein
LHKILIAVRVVVAGDCGRWARDGETTSDETSGRNNPSTKVNVDVMKVSVVVVHMDCCAWCLSPCDSMRTATTHQIILWSVNSPRK